jgi:hypothetical protein
MLMLVLVDSKPAKVLSGSGFHKTKVTHQVLP